MVEGGYKYVSKKRFSFDDEVDDTIDLSKDDLKNSSITNNDKPSNDNVFADEDGLDAKAYPTDNGEINQ